LPTCWTMRVWMPGGKHSRSSRYNALKHTTAGGLLDIEADARSRWAVLRVVDTGEGIPEQALPKVGTPFYRVAEARQRPAGGAGLGLSIANELVRLMRGEMRTCQSGEPIERSTCVWLCLIHFDGSACRGPPCRARTRTFPPLGMTATVEEHVSGARQ
jgi:signal transduction histidine kinase